MATVGDLDGVRVPLARIPEAERTDSAGLLRGHFSVNQAVLEEKIRPIIQDLMSQTRYADRLHLLEQGLTAARMHLQRKVESEALFSLRNQLQEILRFQSQNKADLQQQINDVAASNAVLEDRLMSLGQETSENVVAVQSGLEELIATANAKADQSYVNKTNSAVQKLTQAVTQVDAFSAEVAASMERLDVLQLPQSLQRIRADLTAAAKKANQVQLELLGRVEQRAFHDIVAAVKDSEIKSGKVTQELRCDIAEVKRQLHQQVNRVEMDQVQVLQQRQAEALAHKADLRNVQQIAAEVESVSGALRGKADMDNLAELATRVVQLEAGVECCGLPAQMTICQEGIGDKEEATPLVVGISG